MKQRCPRHGHQPCHCQKPVKEIMYPVKENIVHHCTKEVVKHIHPSHTTVVNHHITKNKHLFPHSTSVKNTFDEMDFYEQNNFNQSPNDVAGIMNNNNCNKKHKPYMGNKKYNHRRP